MNVDGYDHINLKVPDSRIDDCLTFYRDTLGLEPTDDLEAYRQGDRPIFGFWLTDDSLIHITPVDEADSPAVEYGHFAIRVTDDIETIRQLIENSPVGSVIRESTPKGAQGRANAIYVTDPFGHRIEIKETNTTR